ncbi:MAG: sugar porter family MFS transporter [Serratia sp. (in: enterobacteria)]|uniref:sugar porter family MFS transporter n=1 Tax=Serratia sp. (in: enterobacteria) TaxID=616 RepID=UPI003F360804
MEKPKSTNMVYLIGYVTTLLFGSLIFGYNINVFSIFTDMFMQSFNWENDSSKKDLWSSIMTTVLPAGAMVTALTSGPVIKKSKRLVLFIGAFLCAIGVLFMSIIFNPNMESTSGALTIFCIGRIFMGFAVGFYSSVVPPYINEISPKHLTGAFGSCHQLCITFAILIVSIFGLGLPTLSNQEVRDHLSWRFGYAGPFFLSLIQVILILTVYRYESAVHYLSKGDEENAKLSLQAIYSDPNEAEAIFKEMSNAAKCTNSGDSNEEVTGSLYSIYKKAFWFGILLPAIQQLTGINAVMFYAPTMFENQGDIKTLLNFIVMLLNFLFTIVSMFTSDKFGRKILFVLGCFGCGVGLLMATIGYTEDETEGMTASSYIFDIGVFLFTASFGISHGPVCWTYVSEILPSQWMGYGAASSWTFTVIVGLVTPYMLSGIGRWSFLIFLMFMVVSAVFFIICLDETKGKTKKEIMGMFRSEVKSKVKENSNELPKPIEAPQNLDEPQAINPVPEL